MALEYTRNPGKAILPIRIMSELNEDATIKALPSEVAGISWDSVGDVLILTFTNSLDGASETAMDAVITAHIGTPLTTPYVTSPEIATDVNNYGFAGSNDSNIWYLDTDGGAHDITGIIPVLKDITIFNDNASGNLKFKVENVLSDAENRFDIDADFTIAPKRAARIVYNDTIQRWQLR